MKKILFLIICFFALFNVSAWDFPYKTVSYSVDIGGKTYAAVAYYSKLNNNTYEFKNLIIAGVGNDNSVEYHIGDGIANFTVGSPSYCYEKEYDPYACDYTQNGTKTFVITEEDFENGNINTYLPKIIMSSNGEKITFKGSSYTFLYYFADESNISESSRNEFLSDLQSFYQEHDEINSNISMISQSNITRNKILNTEYENINFSNIETVNTNDLTNDNYIELGSQLKELLDNAKDIKVCTEEDLNSIRSKRDVSLLELGKANILLSSACNEVLFGDNNMFAIVSTLYVYMNNSESLYLKSDRFYKMSYLYSESFYLQAISFLSGSMMQVEEEDVTKCSLFGDKTTDLFQQVFDVLKYIGIILGTLLGIVDVFKIVVSKDVDEKKNLKILSKRIIFIVALILTPVIVKILFDFINTFGIDDPLCGIR